MRLGSDPEVFLADKSGALISAIGYINADKWNPMQIPDMANGFTLQEDNVALEYGIPPASSAAEFAAHIDAVMKKSLEYLPNLQFSKISCAVFPESQLQHPLAHVFGCEPDFNAWTKGMNPAPNPPHPHMRSAGGHIHVETTNACIPGVRAMDLFLGVPSVLMDKGEDRKQMYGKAGAHRKKPYGFEYRTLSNFWIFEPKLIEWVWRATQRAMENIGVAETVKDRILQAINKNDKMVAESLVKDFNLELV